MYSTQRRSFSQLLQVTCYCSPGARDDRSLDSVRRTVALLTGMAFMRMQPHPGWQREVMRYLKGL